MKARLSKILLWHEMGATGLIEYMQCNGIRTIVNDYCSSELEYEAYDIEESFDFFLYYLPDAKHN